MNFKGYCVMGDNTMHIISKIERKMYPVKIRFGVGEITTEGFLYPNKYLGLLHY